MLSAVISTVDNGGDEPAETQIEFFFGGTGIGVLSLEDDSTQAVLRVLTAGGADIHDLRDRRVHAPVTPP